MGHGGRLGRGGSGAAGADGRETRKWHVKLMNIACVTVTQTQSSR